MDIDLEVIFKAADTKMSSDERKNIMDDLVGEIKAQFLFMIDNDDGRYCFTLKQAYTWIGNPEVHEKYTKAKEKFKERYLFIAKNQKNFTEADSMFDQASHEKELFKDYFIKKEGRSEEIYFSVAGFQTFCMSQNKGIRAKAVKKYFIVLQSEYLKAIRASNSEQKLIRTELENKLTELQEQQGDRPISEMVDKDFLAKLERIESERQVFETKAHVAHFELKQNEILTHDLRRQCLPDGTEDSYQKIVNARLREKEFPYLIEVYQISTPTVNKWIRSQRCNKKNSKNKTIGTGKKPIISSGSESETETEIETESVTTVSSEYSGWGLSAKLIGILADTHVSAEDLSDEELYEANHGSQLGYYSLQSFGKGAISLSTKDQKKIDKWMFNETKSLNKKKKKPIMEFVLCTDFIRVNSKAHYNLILKNLGTIRISRGRNKIFHTSMDSIHMAADLSYVDLLNPDPIEPAISLSPTSIKIAEPASFVTEHLAKRRVERKALKARAI
jgi:hypothetical protein